MLVEGCSQHYLMSSIQPAHDAEAKRSGWTVSLASAAGSSEASQVSPDPVQILYKLPASCTLLCLSWQGMLDAVHQRNVLQLQSLLQKDLDINSTPLPGDTLYA